MIVGMAIGFQLKEKTMAAKFFSISSKSSLLELADLIKTKYVDKVQEDSINAMVANELLQHLDPHSVFIPAAELNEVNEELMGNFQGIGIEFRLINDTVNVMNVIKGGPSEKAGLLIGDKLLMVADSIAVSGKHADADYVRKVFRGAANSTIKVKFLRGKTFQNIAITRSVIPVSSIDAAYMIAPGKGYIRINKFAERTYEEFMQNLEALLAQKMESLVIDLRGNGGGLMKEAVDIADEFLDDDKLIVYTEGEHSQRMEYHAKRPGLFEKGKMVVLVDETSASASEVLAGALQDWDRATIVGRRTFGKGLVQQQYQLSDGAAVRLTIARYYTPLGRNIQKPYNKGIKEYQEELMSRYHATTDTASKKYEGDSTRKSFKTKKGKIVYGGGGITPDVMVAYDSAKYSNEFIQLVISGTLQNFTYLYFVENNAPFQQYKKPEDFARAYLPGIPEWEKLVKYAQKDTINLSKLPQGARDLILERFKALVSRHIWRDQGYYMVLNSGDGIVQKGLGEVK
jgi:carboxyl-terminal processing protease